MPIFRGREFTSSLSDLKDSVRVAAATNINLAATSVTTIDGVLLNNLDRVLLPKQTVGSQNGIYTWSSTNNKFTRARDADSSAEVTSGLTVYVEEGDTNAQSTFMLSNIGNISLGATSLVFTKTHAILAVSTDGQYGSSTQSAVITVNKAGQVTAVSEAPIYISNSNLEFNSITINSGEVPLGGEISLDADDIAEGMTNKYYLDSRVRAAISVSGDLSYDSPTGVISYTVTKEAIEALNIDIDGGSF